jgi:hypothetical protein
MRYTISAFVGVKYSVNLQNARCKNKDNVYVSLHVYYVFVVISFTQNFCITFLLPRLPV